MSSGKATVRVDNRIRIFNRVNQSAMERALARMRQDIFVLSQFKVPKKEGTLQHSGEQLHMALLHHRVQYGDNGAEEYAAYQHRGERKDGSRKVKKYTTAGTQKNYLGSAGDIIASKAASYFKQEAATARV